MKKNLLLCLIILSSIFRLQADSWTYHRYVGLEGVNVIIPSDSDHFWTRIDNFTFWKFDGKSKEPELLTLNSLCKNFKADKFNNLWTVQDSTGFFVYKENQIQYIPIPDSFLFPQYFEITNFFIDNKDNKYFSLNGRTIVYDNYNFKEFKIQISDSTYDRFTSIFCNHNGAIYLKKMNTYFYKSFGKYEKMDAPSNMSFIGFGSGDKMYFLDNVDKKRIVVYEYGQQINEIKYTGISTDFNSARIRVNKNDEILDNSLIKKIRYYDGKNWLEYDFSQYSNTAYTSIDDKNGVFWMTTKNGLLLFDSGKFTIKQSIQYGLSNIASSAVKLNDDSLLISCYNFTISPINVFTKEKYYEFDTLPNNKIKQNLVQGKNGILYGRIDDYVFEYKNGSWDTLKVNNHILKAQSIYKSKSGDLWFFWPGNILKYDGITWSILAFPGSENFYINYDGEFTMAEDTTGNIWVSMNKYGLYNYNGDTWVTYNKVNTGIDAMYSIVGVAFDKQNIMYVATWGGLIIYDGISWKLHDTSNSQIPTDVLINMAIDQNDIIWMNDCNGLVCTYDHGAFSLFAKNLINFRVARITVDEDNNKYFYTGDGLIIYNEKDAPPPPSVIPTSTQVQLYPNPLHTAFSIDALQLNDRVKVYSMQGQKVIDVTIKNEGKNSFDVSALTNGIYIVNVDRNNRQLYSSKLIKK